MTPRIGERATVRRSSGGRGPAALRASLAASPPATLLLMNTSGTMPRAMSRSTISATIAFTIAAPTTVDVGPTGPGSPSIVDRRVTHDAAIVDGHVHQLVEPRTTRVARGGAAWRGAGW